MTTNKPSRMMGRAIALAMLRTDATQLTVAAACGLTGSAVSRMCAGLRRPDPASLASLLAAPCWDMADRARIMIGHLRDEMSRAGWRRPREIAIYPRPPADRDRAGAARAALVLLADHAHIDEIGELLIDIADLVQRGIAADDDARQAAEDGPENRCIQYAPRTPKNRNHAKPVEKLIRNENKPEQ